MLLQFVKLLCKICTINLIQATSVRLISDKGGRMKGFGYAEFSTLQDLMDALSLTGRVCFIFSTPCCFFSYSYDCVVLSIYRNLLVTFLFL